MKMKTVRGLLLAYEKEESRGMIINLGSGQKMTMNSLIHGICDYMGYGGEWDYKQERISDVRNLCADISRARKVLGFEPQVSFKVGIKETLDWYINNSVI